MTEKDSSKALETLFKECGSPAELAGAIDKAMLSMVILLRYEPESLETVIESYENLYGLRNLILNQSL
jgi:hypothetical protein